MMLVYLVMLQSACEDGALSGKLLFYGANLPYETTVYDLPGEADYRQCLTKRLIY
jgi:hypothetical protein